jgi:hypothetical protein
MKWRVVIQRNGRSRREQEQQVVAAELEDLPRLIGDPNKILHLQLAPEGGLFSQWREEKKC